MSDVVETKKGGSEKEEIVLSDFEFLLPDGTRMRYDYTDFDAKLKIFFTTHNDIFARLFPEDLSHSERSRRLDFIKENLEGSVGRAVTMAIQEYNRDPETIDIQFEVHSRIEDVLAKLELSLAAATDALTKLMMRRPFMDLLHAEVAGHLAYLEKEENKKRKKEKMDEGSENSEKNFSLLFLDIDHFRDVNTKKGHEGGNVILRQFADIAKTQLRESDVMARYGGEEFVIICRDTDKNGAIALAKRISAAVRNGKTDVPITVSIGVTDFHGIKLPEAKIWEEEQSKGKLNTKSEMIDFIAKSMVMTADKNLYILKGNNSDVNGKIADRRGKIACDGMVIDSVA